MWPVGEHGAQRTVQRALLAGALAARRVAGGRARTAGGAVRARDLQSNLQSSGDSRRQGQDRRVPAGAQAVSRRPARAAAGRRTRVRQHRPVPRPLAAADARDAAGLPVDADPDRVALRVSRPGAGRAGARHGRRQRRPAGVAPAGEPRCRGRTASRDAGAARRFERRDLLASTRRHSRARTI